MPSVAILALLAVSALVTSFISGILGMAGGMILMGILLAVMPLPVAMMLHGITQLASNGWRALMWRREVDWRVFRGYLYGTIVTTILFIVVKLVVSKPIALIAMGLTPFITLALPEKLHLNVERRGHATACGIICSTLSLTAGVSGPILDIFFVRSKMGRHAVIATKAMTQSLSHIMKIAYFGAFISVEGASIHPALGAMMVLLAFTGTSLSKHVIARMNDESFRFWTRRTVMTLGLFYLASGVWMVVK
ncbi:MAG TPA: sulfite exporter TauE/SafE family protein [Usitatibacter sp.]|nr:sulfite exporter TauE/SafE family protein [Usitatibacter sp.]